MLTAPPHDAVAVPPTAIISRIGQALRLHGLSRADFGVLAFCALGAGNLWARRGAGNAGVAASPPSFLFGFALLVAAGLLCLLAVGRSSSLPGAIVCTAALAAQTVIEPWFLIPGPELYAVGLALAMVPLLRSSRVAWALVAAAFAITAVGVAGEWTWGTVSNDVFAEVQGSAQALLHGHNPYSAVYTVYLDSQGGHALFASAALGYGPTVVILSLPARLLGDVRLTVLALNLAILAAILVWTRRGGGSRRLGPTITALWVASPFVPFMVLLEWTDTFCVAGVVWWLVLRDRHRNWAIVALTAGLASKPSMLPVMVPLLLWTSAARKELLWSLVGTVVIAAPFALWTGMAQFFYDTVGIYGDLPTSHGSVNLNGLATVFGHGFLPGGVLLAGMAVTVVIFLLRRFRDYGDLLIAGAGILTFICFFGKQSFLNYFFNAAIALLFVAGSGSLRPRDLGNQPWGGAALSRVVPVVGRLWRPREPAQSAVSSGEVAGGDRGA
jgi:hypothetical protein